MNVYLQILKFLKIKIKKWIATAMNVNQKITLFLHGSYT